MGAPLDGDLRSAGGGDAQEQLPQGVAEGRSALGLRQAPDQRRGHRPAQGLLLFGAPGSAHYVLGPFGSDSDLRRHGEKIAARGGKNAKKRAVVAVARKLSVLLLSVLLHRLWVSGEVYDPLHNAHRRQSKDAA